MEMIVDRRYLPEIGSTAVLQSDARQVFFLLRKFKGVFYGIDIAYYCCFASFRRVASMELQPQLGLRANRRLGIGTNCSADNGTAGIHSPRLLSK
jgi:hypothetical protein